MIRMNKKFYTELLYSHADNSTRIDIIYPSNFY